MREKDQRFFDLAKSLWSYFLLSRRIYLTILVIAFLSWLVSLPVGWREGGVYDHWINFLTNLAPSMLAAFVILLLTDFISREYLKRLFREQKEGAETTQEAFDWGLRLYPSHSNKIIKTRRQVLEEYLEPGDEIRILSGNGFSWFTHSDSILELLVDDEIETRVILFSPELYFENLLASCRSAESAELLDRWVQQLAHEQLFSRYQTRGHALINNHRQIKDELNALPREKRARITVRYTGIIPLCEFFVIGAKRAHGAVPMHTKTHRKSFAIQTFRGLRYGNDNVKEFIAEFDHFWKSENSISEKEYFTKYARVDGINEPPAK